MKRPRAPSLAPALVLYAISITSVLITGCGKEDGSLASAAQSVGLADAPPLPAEGVDILCDMSMNTPCTAARVRELLDALLPGLAQKPGSRLRVWTIGRDVGHVELLTELRVPDPPKQKKRQKAATQAWIESTERLILKLLEPFAAQPPAQRSPLFEAVTKVGLATMPGVSRRRMFVISDGLEYSGYANFESADIPTAAELLPVLHRDRVLTPGVLKDTDVAFIFNDVSRLPSGRGKSSVARMVAITDAWDRLLREGGATSVSFAAGLPALDSVPMKGAQK